MQKNGKMTAVANWVLIIVHAGLLVHLLGRLTSTHGKIRGVDLVCEVLIIAVHLCVRQRTE